QSSLMMILRRGWASANVALARTHPIRTSFLLCIALRIRQKAGQTRFPGLPSTCRHTRLEPQLQGELNQAGIVYGVVDHAEATGSIDILLATASRAAHVELGLIEQVEALGAELQVGALAESQRDFLTD